MEYLYNDQGKVVALLLFYNKCYYFTFTTNLYKHTHITCDSLVLHNNTHVNPLYLVFSFIKCNFVITCMRIVCVCFEKIKCCRLYLFESGNLGLIMFQEDTGVSFYIYIFHAFFWFNVIHLEFRATC